MKKLLYLALTLSMALHAVGASALVSERPKIGLVLSGGGAKGLAHIGVLKAIDEAGLNIDYITGTSMGAILAAMYAAGYSGEEIEEIARGMDWSTAMGSGIDYHKLSLENKDEYDAFLLEMPIRKWKIVQTTGFVEPQELMLKFSEVFYPVYKTKKFDELQIPFKCIATDLRTGNAVVLDRGDLVNAVRSSMAIPGVFTATSYRNTKLIDGGVVRNFPVRDVKNMGADYVIGVNLFSGLTPLDNISTMIDVMMQVMNFGDAKDLIEEKQMCDMLIEPNVSKYSASSFGASEEIISIGDSIGGRYLDKFKQIADTLNARYGLPYTTGKNRMEAYPDSVRLTDFKIEGLRYTDKAMLMHNLNLEAGKSYTPVELNAAFRHAYTSRFYDNLTYELLPVENDTTEGDVVLKCKVQEMARTLLKIGLSYNTFTSASLNVGISRSNLFGTRSNLDAKIAISESMRARLRSRMYIGKNYNRIFDVQYSFTNYSVPIYGEKTQKKDYIYSYWHNNFLVSLNNLMLKKDNVGLKATLGFDAFKFTPEINNDKMQLDGTIKNFYFEFTRMHNTLDRKYLPRHGRLIKTDVYWAIKPKYNVKSSVDEDGNEVIFSRKHAIRATYEGDFYQTPNDGRLTLIESFGLGANYQDQSIAHRTALGGTDKFMPSHFAFYGINTASKFASTLAVGRLGAQYNLVGELYTNLYLNLGVTFDSIDSYVVEKTKFGVEEWLYGGGLTIAYNLSRMPFDITLMTARHYGFNVSVNVGFLF